MIAILRLLHHAVLLFIVFGWLLPVAFLPWHIGFTLAVVVQWWVNKGTCILTNLENWLTQKPATPDEAQGQFIKQLLGKCFQPLPSDKQIKIGLYIFLAVILTISSLRILWQSGS